MVIIAPRTEADQRDLEREIAAALEASLDDADAVADRRDEDSSHATQPAVDTPPIAEPADDEEDRATPFVDFELCERENSTPDLLMEPVQDLVVEASAQCIDVIDTYYRFPARSWLILLAVAIGVAAVTAAVVRSEVGWWRRVSVHVCSQQQQH